MAEYWVFTASYISCLVTPIMVTFQSEQEQWQTQLALVVLDGLLSACVVTDRKFALSKLIIGISVVPSVAWLVAQGVEQAEWATWFSFVRMIKIVLLPRQYKSANKCHDIRCGEASTKIGGICLLFCIFASTMACVWFGLSCTFIEGLSSQCSDNTWVASDLLDDRMSVHSTASKYFRSLHFVTQTLATIGYGDIHPVNQTETLFCLMLLLSGALIYGYVISCITSLLSNRDITAKLFRSELAQLKDYLKLRQLGDVVREKFISYLEFLFTRQLGLTEEAVLAALPDEIAQDVRLHCCAAILKNVPFFKTRPDRDAFVAVCVRKMRLVTYAPGTVLTATGSAERVLFLVRSGKVELLLAQTKKSVLSLIAGDFFGDYHMLFGCPVEAEAVAAGFTGVATLSYASLAEVLEHYSDRRAPITSPNTAPSSGRRRRETSLVQLTREVRQFTSSTDTTAEVPYVAPDAGHNLLGVGTLSNVRLKPLPGRRVAMMAAVAPASQAMSGTPAVVGLVPSVTSPNAQSDGSAPVAGPHTPAGKHMYRTSLRATFDAHQALLARMNKTQQSMEATARTKKLAAMMETTAVMAHTATIAPSHLFRFYWGCVLLVVVLYYNFAVPLRIMAQYHCEVPGLSAAQCLSRWEPSLIIDYLCDAIVLAEVVLQARFFAFRRYEGDRMIEETDPTAIWGRFRRSSTFWVLVVLLVPVDLLAPLVGYLLCLRCVKVLSLCLLSEAVLELQAWLDHERGVTLNAEAIAVAQLAVHTTVVTVWMSVAWCLLHYGGAQHSAWVSAFYWTLTSITTTGYGDITPTNTSQTMFNVAVNIVGPTIFATIIAKFASYVKKVDVSTNNVEHRLATATQFIRTLVPADSSSDWSMTEQDNRGSVFEVEPNDAAGMGNISTKTGTGSLKTSGSAPPLLHRLSSLGVSAANLFRETAQQTAGAARVITQVLQRYRAPQSLSSRAGMESAVGAYFLYMDRGGQALLEGTTIAVAEPTQVELRKATLLEAVAALPVFAKCSAELHSRVVSAMVQQLHPHHSTLLDGCPADGLYLVKTGAVKVKDMGQERASTCQVGQCFGAEVLLGTSATALEVTARTDCELWLLSKADFESIISSLKTCRKEEVLHHMRAALTAESSLLRRQLSVSTSISHSTSRPVNAHLRRANVAVRPDDLVAVNMLHEKLNAESQYVLHPDGTAALTWSAVLGAFALYNFAVIPLRVAFYQGCEVTAAYCVDYLGDLLFLADLVLRLRFLGYSERDQLVLSPWKIQEHYLHSGRILRDVASLLPLDLIALAAPLGTLGSAQVLSLFRMNRLLRLYDAAHTATMLEQLLSKLVTARSQGQKNLLRLTKLILSIFLIAHLMGCGFFLIANQLHLAGDDNNWAEAAGLFQDARDGVQPSTQLIFTQYVCSVYWAMAMLTTVGYGDISPVSVYERAYNIVLFVVGALVYAAVIVHLQDIVSQLDVTSDLFKTRVRKVQAFLHREQTAADFTTKVSVYQEKLWAVQRGADGTEIRQFLPAHLYSAAMHSNIAPYLTQLFFVQKCDAAFQSAFLSELQVVHYLKDDVVFRTGEAAQRLYFIAQGDVSLVTMDLQTDTATAVDATVGPMRHRNSVLGSIGQRRSVQQSPFKAQLASQQSMKGPRISLSMFGRRGSVVPTASEAVPLQMGGRRSSALVLGLSGGSTTGAAGAGGSAAAKKKKGRRTSYLKVHDGFIGETEFFTRACYSCSAKTTSDTIMLEMSFDNCWALLKRHRLEDAYRRHLRDDPAVLHRNSTASVVQRLDNNMANRKMAKMMSVCITEAPRLSCYLPDSHAAVACQAICLAMLVALASSVPYFVAFPGTDNVLPSLVLDSVATVVFAVMMYLRACKLAVVVDGSLITDPAEIYRNYMGHSFWLDLISTFPLGLLVFVAARSSPLYAVLRWLSMLRLRRAGGWINSLLLHASTALERPLSDSARRLVTAILAVLYAAHVAACLLCTIGRLETSAGVLSWIEANEYAAGRDVSVYLRAYYWALYTLTTTGYGNIALVTSGERIFAMVVMVLGSIMNAMLSALLCSLVESADQSSSHARRAAEAVDKFCLTNQVDSATRTKAAQYFSYLTDTLGNSTDAEGFALLSKALRVELVCRTAWRALRRVNYLEGNTFDKAAQHGFILSVARKMRDYLAIPGEVLADESLDTLMDALQDTATTNTRSEVTAARSVHSQKSVRRPGPKFYKGVDLMVVRRGDVVAELQSADRKAASEVPLCGGQVVNMFALMTQLCSMRSAGASGAAHRDSAFSSAPSRRTSALSEATSVPNAPAHQRYTVQVHMLAEASTTYDELQLSIVKQGTTALKPDGCGVFVGEAVLTQPDQPCEMQVMSTTGCLLGTALLHGQTLHSSGSSTNTDSEELCTAEQQGGVEEQDSIIAGHRPPDHRPPDRSTMYAVHPEAQPLEVSAHDSDGSDSGDDSATMFSDDESSLDDTLTVSSRSVQPPRLSASKKLASSYQFSSLPLRCISEESAGSELSDRDQTHSGVAAGLHNETSTIAKGESEELRLELRAEDGEVIGHLALSKCANAASHTQQSDRDQDSFHDCDNEKRGVDQEADEHVRVVAHGYCHLFRASIEDCREVEEFFWTAQQPVSQRCK